MAVTFNATLSTSRDKIRFLLAQTTSASVIQDETIDALIAQQPTLNLAAMQAAMFLASHYAQLHIETAALDVKAKYLDRSKFYYELANKLRTGEITVDGQPVTGFAVGELSEPDLTGYRTD
jgi:hypothetical protein